MSMYIKVCLIPIDLLFHGIYTLLFYNEIIMLVVTWSLKHSCSWICECVCFQWIYCTMHYVLCCVVSVMKSLCFFYIWKLKHPYPCVCTCACLQWTYCSMQYVLYYVISITKSLFLLLLETQIFMSMYFQVLCVQWTYFLCNMYFIM